MLPDGETLVLHLNCNSTKNAQQRRNLDFELSPTRFDEIPIGLLGGTSLSARMIINNFEVGKFIMKARHQSSISDMPHDSDNSFHLRFLQLNLKLQTWETDACEALALLKVRTLSNTIHSIERDAPLFDIYPGPWTLSLWNKHRAGRILLHQTFLDVFYSSPSPSVLSSLHEEQRSLSQSIILDCADDILASVPFALSSGSGDSWPPRGVNGYFLIWSLQVVLRCSYTNFAQRTLARDNLKRVGKECGLNYALVYAREYVLENVSVSRRKFNTLCQETDNQPFVR